MEGYTENGAGTDVADQIGFAGIRRKKKAAPRIERIPAQGNRRGGAGAFRRQYHAGATDFRIRHEQHDVAYGHGAMRSGVVVRRADLRVAAGARLPADAQSRGIRRAAAVLALIAEVPYDLATSGKPFDFGSQNPVFGLFIAFAMLAAMKWVAQRYQGAMLVISDIVLVVVAVLWDLLLRVGLRQHLMSLGAVTLGFVLIFWLMRSRENTMMFTAGLFGAVMMIAPGVGVAFVHYYNGKLGYKHSWTKWMFYAFYPVILLICAAVA